MKKIYTFFLLTGLLAFSSSSLALAQTAGYPNNFGPGAYSSSQYQQRLAQVNGLLYGNINMYPQGSNPYPNQNMYPYYPYYPTSTYPTSTYPTQYPYYPYYPYPTTTPTYPATTGTTTSVRIMVHVCPAGITDINSFNNLGSFTAKEQACRSVVEPNDTPYPGSISGGQQSFGFTVQTQNGNMSIPASSPRFVQDRICEGTLNTDVNNDGSISNSDCLDSSTYSYDNLPVGPTTVIQTTPVIGTHFGTVEFTPTNIVPNNNQAALVSVDTTNGVIQLDTSRTSDQIIVLHVFDFSNSTMPTNPTPTTPTMPTIPTNIPPATQYPPTYPAYPTQNTTTPLPNNMFPYNGISPYVSRPPVVPATPPTPFRPLISIPAPIRTVPPIPAPATVVPPTASVPPVVSVPPAVTAPTMPASAVTPNPIMSTQQPPQANAQTAIGSDLLMRDQIAAQLQRSLSAISGDISRIAAAVATLRIFPQTQ